MKHLIRTTVKLSYSTTKNMISLIAPHNRSILNPNYQVYNCNSKVRQGEKQLSPAT